jgi:hypothetical protein
MAFKLDIAGFYYRRSNISAKPNPTVQDIMNAASDADIAERAAGGKNPLLQYMVDPSHPAFISTISVHHLTRAISGQMNEKAPRRSYDPGEYVFTDEPVLPMTNSNGDIYFVAADQNGQPIASNSIRTWQYYIYDANGVERSRAPGVIERKVVPFSQQPVADGSTIVWRVVSIFLKPTWHGGVKTYSA